MFELVVENEYKQQLKLSQNEDSYQILEIQGLTPPTATINSIVNASGHGTSFKNARVEERNIVITVKLCGDVEANRIKLYDYFASSRNCKIYFRNGTRNVSIEGCVENVESNLFENNQTMQISVICNNPFFYDVKASTKDISKQHNNFEFPFSSEIQEGIEFSIFERDYFACVVNYGEGDTGMIIEIENTLSDNQELPIPVIRNYATGESLRVNGTFSGGEKIIINTNVGQKSIKKISNGAETNLLNSFDLKSNWLKLRKGANHFTYDYNEYDKFYRINIIYSSAYLGV